MAPVIIKRCVLLLSMIVLLAGCKKYLDAKPDKKLVIPGSLGDLQSLLDYYNRLNENDATVVAEVSSDNYYLTDADWNAMPENYRRMYTWEKDLLFTPYPNQWSFSYDKVYVANVVLDNLEKIQRKESDQDQWDKIKGQALCFRAKTFLDVASVWCLAYDKTTAQTDLGIPLRLNSDFNQPSVRSNLRQTYDQIVSDFKQSIPLLPMTSNSIFQPSRIAAYAFLARTYLFMREYDSAYKYSDLCLQLKNTLMDYNSDQQVIPAGNYPFAQFNKEVIMESRASVISPMDNGRAKIDSNLFASYDNNDLRKMLFFKSNNNGSYGFKGSYEGSAAMFTSIAIDEVYLMRAECAARRGMIQQAMNDLNALLLKRWKSSAPFVAFTAIDASDALRQILDERRKELIMRGQ